MTTIDAKHIIKGKGGKEFVSLAGLLEAAYAAGLKAISSHVVQSPSPENGKVAVVEVTAIFPDAAWTCVGDASPESCPPGSGLHVALPRFAESRGLARALRFALHVDLTADVEMGAEQLETRQNRSQTQQRGNAEASLKPATLTSIVRARNDVGVDSERLLTYAAVQFKRGGITDLEQLTEREGQALLKALRTKLEQHEKAGV